MPLLEDANIGKIERLAHALFPSLAMLAGMQLDLFSPLADGPKTAGELAAALDVPEMKLRPLLDALVIAELLEPVGDGRYRNDPEADECLVAGRPTYRGGVHTLYADIWPPLFHTAQSIRTGRPQDPHDFALMDDDALSAFYRGMHGGNQAKGRALLTTGLPLDDRRRLLDVGGGSGGMTLALCQGLPDLSATILELPRVAPITRRFVAEAGFEGRIGVIEGDAVAAPPTGRYDLATLSSVIQVLDPGAAAKLLVNVGRALEPGGRIVITGRILNDDRLSPQHVALFNLVFLNIYDGGLAHTEAEHRDWLQAAGFTNIERRPMKEAELITAVRAA